jgi:CubicO group peptidase (beta-lactamase class C family)
MNLLTVLVLGAVIARFAAFDAFIAQTLKAYHVPGAAVVVVENGKIAFIKGYGVREITKLARVDENTIFQMASVTKTFTAAAAGTVVDDGKLSWDKPIVTYMPLFQFYDPYLTRYATERDLLAMRTGWPAFTGDQLDDFGYTRPEILERLRYLKPAVSFRELSEYSNPSYFTAGEVAAAASGISWNDLVQKRLFAPLDMTRSGTSVHDLSDPNSYTPHVLVNGIAVPTTPTNQDTMGAAGAITSTARDIGHYLQMYLDDGRYDGRQILKSETVREIYKRSMVAQIEFTELPPISERTGFYYGLGFDSFDYAGYHVIEKAGALAGVRTVMTMIPEKHAGIAVFANLNVTALPEAVRTYYIEKVLLGRSPDVDLREITERNEKFMSMFAPRKPPSDPAPFTGKLDGLAGSYENPLYGRCDIARESSGMAMLCGPAKKRAPLEHRTGNEFIAQWPGATSLGDDVTFKMGSNGVADAFTDDVLGEFTRVRDK